jgi:hypothetical protein
MEWEKVHYRLLLSITVRIFGCFHYRYHYRWKSQFRHALLPSNIGYNIAYQLSIYSLKIPRLPNRWLIGVSNIVYDQIMDNQLLQLYASYRFSIYIWRGKLSKSKSYDIIKTFNMLPICQTTALPAPNVREWQKLVGEKTYEIKRNSTTYFTLS